MHCTQYTVHSSQYTVHSTLYKAHSTQYTILNAVRNTQFTVHSTEHSTEYPFHFTQETVHNTQYKVFKVHYHKSCIGCHTVCHSLNSTIRKQYTVLPSHLGCALLVECSRFCFQHRFIRLQTVFSRDSSKICEVKK